MADKKKKRKIIQTTVAKDIDLSAVGDVARGLTEDGFGGLTEDGLGGLTEDLDTPNTQAPTAGVTSITVAGDATNSTALTLQANPTTGDAKITYALHESDLAQRFVTRSTADIIIKCAPDELDAEIAKLPMLITHLLQITVEPPDGTWGNLSFNFMGRSATDWVEIITQSTSTAHWGTVEIMNFTGTVYFAGDPATNACERINAIGQGLVVKIDNTNILGDGQGLMLRAEQGAKIEDAWGFGTWAQTDTSGSSGRFKAEQGSTIKLAGDVITSFNPNDKLFEINSGGKIIIGGAINNLTPAQWSDDGSGTLIICGRTIVPDDNDINAIKVNGGTVQKPDSTGLLNLSVPAGGGGQVNTVTLTGGGDVVVTDSAGNTTVDIKKTITATVPITGITMDGATITPSNKIAALTSKVTSVNGQTGTVSLAIPVLPTNIVQTVKVNGGAVQTPDATGLLALSVPTGGGGAVNTVSVNSGTAISPDNNGNVNLPNLMTYNQAATVTITGTLEQVQAAVDNMPHSCVFDVTISPTANIAEAVIDFKGRTAINGSTIHCKAVNSGTAYVKRLTIQGLQGYIQMDTLPQTDFIIVGKVSVYIPLSQVPNTERLYRAEKSATLELDCDSSGTAWQYPTLAAINGGKIIVDCGYYTLPLPTPAAECFRTTMGGQITIYSTNPVDKATSIPADYYYTDGTGTLIVNNNLIYPTTGGGQMDNLKLTGSGNVTVSEDADSTALYPKYTIGAALTTTANINIACADGAVQAEVNKLPQIINHTVTFTVSDGGAQCNANFGGRTGNGTIVFTGLCSHEFHVGNFLGDAIELNGLAVTHKLYCYGKGTRIRLNSTCTIGGYWTSGVRFGFIDDCTVFFNNFDFSTYGYVSSLVSFLVRNATVIVDCDVEALPDFSNQNNNFIGVDKNSKLIFINAPVGIWTSNITGTNAYDGGVITVEGKQLMPATVDSISVNNSPDILPNNMGNINIVIPPVMWQGAYPTTPIPAADLQDALDDIPPILLNEITVFVDTAAIDVTADYSVDFHHFALNGYYIYLNFGANATAKFKNFYVTGSTSCLAFQYLKTSTFDITGHGDNFLLDSAVSHQLSIDGDMLLNYETGTVTSYLSYLVMSGLLVLYVGMDSAASGTITVERGGIFDNCNQPIPATMTKINYGGAIYPA